MNYFKIIEDGYIVSIGKTTGKGNISKEEYDEIKQVLIDAPIAPEGYVYKLKENLTWILVKAPVEEIEE